MTPIQQALAHFKDSHNEWTASQITDYLKSHLLKEKQFVEHIWMQGVATGYESGKNGSSSKPTLPEFLNQLYPEK